MFCSKCGKSIPDDSAFCSYCGKQLSGTTPPPQITEWEYKDFVMDWEPNKTGWVAERGYNEPAARLYYWQNYQSEIMPQLQKLLDQGWQPTTDLGPSCIKLRYYKSLEHYPKGVLILIAILSFGTSLLFMNAMDGTWKYQLTRFQVQLRRQKT